MAEDVLAPNFQTMKEFFAYHGDCGQLATLSGLATRDPHRWPLLGATLDTIVADQIRDGFASAALSGGQTIYDISNWLRQHESVPCTIVGWTPSLNTNKQSFSLAALQAALQAQIGTRADGTHYWKRPVLIEVSKAGAGFPQDEPGVEYHFVVVAGVQLPDGGWFRADGDAVRYNDANGGRKPPILTTWSQIITAAPIGYVIIDLDVADVPPEVVMILLDYSNGVVVGAHDKDRPGQRLGSGMAKEAAARSWLTLSLLRGEPHFSNGLVLPSGISYAIFNNATSPAGMMTYSRNWNVQVQAASDIATAFDDALRLAEAARNDSNTFKAQLLTAQADLKASQAEVANYIKTTETLVAQVANYQSMVDELKVQLADCEAQQPPAPPAPPAGYNELLTFLNALGIPHSAA